MAKSNASRFVEKRKNSNARKLFIKVAEYVVFCYHKSITDKVTYSKKYCDTKTSYAFEDFLKIRLVVDYLQDRKNKNACSFPNEISVLNFQYEVEKEYVQSKKIKSDKIDIFVSNLNLGELWSDVNDEDLYFVFECKRLLNTRKNMEYLTDTQKFVSRKYKSFRFPFNGMIGFVEKSSISILKIIENLNERLVNHRNIQSIVKNNNILNTFKIDNFEYCRTSNHKHINKQINIEVFHLFFDYSKTIVN